MNLCILIRRIEVSCLNMIAITMWVLSARCTVHVVNVMVLPVFRVTQGSQHRMWWTITSGKQWFWDSSRRNVYTPNWKALFYRFYCSTFNNIFSLLLSTDLCLLMCQTYFLCFEMKHHRRKSNCGIFVSEVVKLRWMQVEPRWFCSLLLQETFSSFRLWAWYNNVGIIDCNSATWAENWPWFNMYEVTVWCPNCLQFSPKLILHIWGSRI